MKFLSGLAVLAGVALLPARVDATTLSGRLDVNGGVIVTATNINFTCSDPVNTATCNANPTVYGDENIANTSTFKVGGVLVASGSNKVLTKDLDETLFPTTGFTTPLDFFEQLDQFPTVNFQLRDIVSCSELGGGNTCPAGADSPFGFAESCVTVAGITTCSTQVTMILGGLVWDTADPVFYNWIGTYTAQFPGQSIADLIAEFTSQGFIQTSFSASKIVVSQAAVPEPATLLLLGTGLVGGALRSRRRRAVVA